ncbi:DnaA regulatory inactivator Hda [Oceanicoccus sagamiensis]|uniref:DnaA regulatory inactivator Hda n=1 Tax=Oceanicoccus sagamiensis TaxID=716816 RepID=A0A1X9NDD4_9GAMM|nr:DnaA regulatory inactivator Hda [Oceanicoccus sagamiensis]ARN72967.1 DnaA regulatory inactivator Hda [Oceanicoccus sagamiensis]
MSFTFEQLPLAVQLRDDTTFDNFYAGDNALLLETLRAQLPSGERYIFLYGASRGGRSHLLQAACHQADELGLTSVYLPLTELRDYPPQELFEGLEQLSLVCLDDIDTVMGDSDWEQSLFHLFNRLQERQVHLIVSANSAVRELNSGLADLSSRLSWGAVFQLKSLSDPQRSAAIQLRAERRGLELNDEVIQFIYHRCQRDMETLLDVLDTLDHASLKEQRRLTVPFVKDIMGW